ncbi:uncharacterized protein SPSK_03786 [Sporothrix schenckii 1099-18]|uniref:Uncharacterized protein n=1 Tax=Sporothrix schenckii 1099-18 TaxID=1397361 RepID=A0A0F2LY25_SPOSC|nr:uncharacterized protein SPSK_03786 [Sporothrix schenckii 1099-18]KJR82358.1 hypothetical protein SPSK_03786 [Sporothrix schenckii 1099-18]
MARRAVVVETSRKNWSYLVVVVSSSNLLTQYQDDYDLGCDAAAGRKQTGFLASANARHTRRSVDHVALWGGGEWEEWRGVGRVHSVVRCG